MGMSNDDLRRLTLDEFEAIIGEWRRCREEAMHDSWERMRLLATITIQPHSKNRITPRSLMQFPWEENNEARHSAEPQLSKEERLAALTRLMQSQSEL